jgi:hypothetical protein
MTSEVEPQPAAKLEPPAAIGALAANFGAVSAAFTVLSAVLSITFMYSYLSVFDVNLTMAIEYSDIIKIALVGVAFLSGFAIFIYKWRTTGSSTTTRQGNTLFVG